MIVHDDERMFVDIHKDALRIERILQVILFDFFIFDFELG